MRTELVNVPRPGTIIQQVTNGEATATIPRGTPVILNVSSTPQPTTSQDGFAAGFQDGLQVVLPSTAGANPTAMFAYGVAVNDIAPGQNGEAIVHGIVPFALFVRATRANSGASWSSSASSSSAGGFAVSIDTVANAFASYTPSSISLANASSIVTTGGVDIQAAKLPMIVLDSISSISASASTTADTRVNLLTYQRAFVRLM